MFQRISVCLSSASQDSAPGMAGLLDYLKKEDYQYQLLSEVSCNTEFKRIVQPRLLYALYIISVNYRYSNGYKTQDNTCSMYVYVCIFIQIHSNVTH